MLPVVGYRNTITTTTTCVCRQAAPAMSAWAYVALTALPVAVPLLRQHSTPRAEGV
jgi:hypothetical protein